MCPILCPPPNPTECDGVSLRRWKALLGKASVAIRHNRSHSVEVVDSSCDLQAGGRRFESCTAYHLHLSIRVLRQIVARVARSRSIRSIMVYWLTRSPLVLVIERALTSRCRRKQAADGMCGWVFARRDRARAVVGGGLQQVCKILSSAFFSAYIFGLLT